MPSRRVKRLAVGVAAGLAVWAVVIVVAAIATREPEDPTESAEPFLNEFELTPFQPSVGAGGGPIEASPVGSRCDGTDVVISGEDGEEVDLSSAVVWPNDAGNIVRILAADFHLDGGNVSQLGVSDGPDDGTVLEIGLLRAVGEPIDAWTAFEAPAVITNEYSFYVNLQRVGTTVGAGHDQKGSVVVIETEGRWCVEVDLRDSEREISGFIVAALE